MRALLLVLLTAATAAAQTPAGPAFRVNTYTTGSYAFPDVAVDGAGNFVVVWHRTYPQEIRGQRFDRVGARRGAEFRVDAAAGLAYLPQVAAAANGAFTVVWSGSGPAGPDVIGRRYDAAGDPIGGEFLVNAFTAATQSQPSLAAEPSGAFVAAWASAYQDGDGRGIFAQRFDAAGNRLGSEFIVNTGTTGDQTAPAVSVDGSGNFVVVWRSALTSSGPATIAGQRFARDGTPLGAELRITSDPAANASAPAVAAAPGGGFLVVWGDMTDPYTDIRGRHYDAAGVAGAEFIVHATDVSGFVNPAVASDGQGRFVAAWDDAGPSGMGFDIEARRIDAAGAPRGSAFRAHPPRYGSQLHPRVAADTHGNLLIAWSHLADDDSREVHAQRYRALSPAGLEVDRSAGPGSDGNGVFEPGESVELRPVWQNHSGGPLWLSGMLTTLSGPVAGPPWTVYSILDAAGSYGLVADSGIQACVDCYRVAVNPPSRPVQHWDATATEALNADDEGHNAWLLHLGDSFSDVPRTRFAYRFVETLLHARVTTGCGGTAYCPAAAATREQMAPFVLIARDGGSYRPRDCGAPTFADVPASSPFCRWIEELARRGVVGGCGGGKYCPGDAVTREQMAVFVLRTLDPALSPPACTTPVFPDVPASSEFCRWIEELARRGVVTGCGGGNYCPGAAVTREQMGVFLTATFGLSLYGP